MRHDDVLVLDRHAWRSLSTALQRSTLRRAVFDLRPALRDLGFGHVENARRLALRDASGSIATMPGGVTMTVGYDTLTFRGPGGAPARGDDPRVADHSRVLVGPGATALPGGAWMIVAEVLEHWDLEEIRTNPDRWTAFFDLDQLGTSLQIRGRMPGDVFRPQGMGGHRTKVSTLMINCKIPRLARDAVPLLVADDRIAWVCGYRLAEGVGVRDMTKRVLRMRFQRCWRDDADRCASGQAKCKELDYA
jgi:tRNA(Ile)-lysidine synthase